MEDLTREQRELLTAMYRDYMDRQPGLPADKANTFGDCHSLRNDYLPGYSHYKVTDICLKLKQKGYISCSEEEGLTKKISITAKTIAAMERKGKVNLKETASLMSLLK